MSNIHPHYPSQDVPAEIDFAANLALFLLEETGSIYGEWRGKMCAEDQRALMGRYLGRGTIIINGQDETVRNRASVCFGREWQDRNVTTFATLGVAEIEDEPESDDEDDAEFSPDLPDFMLKTLRSGRRMLVSNAAG